MLYIPVQRTGDVSEAAEVTVKVIDASARAGVNYTLEVCKEDVEPEVEALDVPLRDLISDGDYQQETPIPDVNEVGQVILFIFIL